MQKIEKNYKKLKIGFYTLETCHFFILACYIPYLSTFLVKRGYTATQVGLIFMVNSIVVLLMQSVWGIVSDKLRSVKKVYTFLMFVIAAIIPIATLLQGFTEILIFFAVFNLFYCSINSLCDTWVSQGIKSIPNQNYGSYRAWGSLAFTFISFLLGLIIEEYRIEVIFFALSLFALLNGVNSMAIGHHGLPEVKKEVKKLNVSQLLRNFRYVGFIICVLILYIATNLKFNFFYQRLMLAGGNDALYGIGHSLAALSEVPFMILSGFLIRKYTAENTLKFSMFMYFLCQLCCSFNLSPLALTLCQLFSGPSYGIFALSSVIYVDSLSPPELKTSALTIAVSIYFGGGGILGSFLWGRAIDTIGIINSFYASAGMALVAFLLFVIITRVAKKKESAV
ncbi:MAG: MFS transporter [Ruminococcaceae bacterium]|nr:MFS transporter [Oscillospiraceae bacterium]